MITSKGLKIAAGALFLLIASHSGAFAQTTKEQLLGHMLNGETSSYSAPVTILEDHPQCSGPGFLAFSVALEANDVDFRVSGEQWDGTVRQFNRPDALTGTDTCIIGKQRFDASLRPEGLCDISQDRQQVVQKDNPPAACHRTERRGTETSLIEIDCATAPAADQPGTLNALIRDADIGIDISVTADVCQSLTGIGLINSEWTVVVEVGDETEAFMGTFRPNRWFDSAEESPIDLRLRYNRETESLMDMSDELANGPFQLDPMRSGSLGFSLQIKPFIVPNSNGSPLSLDAYRTFRVDVQ